MKTRDILGLGCATIDELLFVDNYPAPDGKVLVNESQTQGGGLTATALVAGARLGARCAYGGMLGFDETSRQIARILQVEKIDISLVSWRADAAAIRSTIVVDQSAHTRAIFFRRAGLVGAPPDAPSEDEIAASRVLLIDHYGGAGNVRAVEIARRRGVPIVADFERINVPHWDEFFPLVDHLIVSQDFAAQLCGETAPENAARALWHSRRAIVVVTAGENGAVAFDGRDVAAVAAYATNVVDTTGCGDVFHGVYAATLAWDWPLQKRLQWASAAASLKARSVGAQAGIARFDEVEALVERGVYSLTQVRRAHPPSPGGRRN